VTDRRPFPGEPRTTDGQVATPYRRPIGNPGDPRAKPELSKMRLRLPGRRSAATSTLRTRRLGALLLAASVVTALAAFPSGAAAYSNSYNVNGINAWCLSLPSAACTSLPADSFAFRYYRLGVSYTYFGYSISGYTCSSPRNDSASDPYIKTIATVVNAGDYPTLVLGGQPIDNSGGQYYNEYCGAKDLALALAANIC
jgi:hypothetical protein